MRSASVRVGLPIRPVTQYSHDLLVRAARLGQCDAGVLSQSVRAKALRANSGRIECDDVGEGILRVAPAKLSRQDKIGAALSGVERGPQAVMTRYPYQLVCLFLSNRYARTVVLRPPHSGHVAQPLSGK